MDDNPKDQEEQKKEEVTLHQTRHTYSVAESRPFTPRLLLQPSGHPKACDILSLLLARCPRWGRYTFPFVLSSWWSTGELLLLFLWAFPWDWDCCMQVAPQEWVTWWTESLLWWAQITYAHFFHSAGGSTFDFNRAPDRLRNGSRVVCSIRPHMINHLTYDVQREGGVSRGCTLDESSPALGNAIGIVRVVQNSYFFSRPPTVRFAQLLQRHSVSYYTARERVTTVSRETKDHQHVVRRWLRVIVENITTQDCDPMDCNHTQSLPHGREWTDFLKAVRITTSLKLDSSQKLRTRHCSLFPEQQGNTPDSSLISGASKQKKTSSRKKRIKTSKKTTNIPLSPLEEWHVMRYMIFAETKTTFPCLRRAWLHVCSGSTSFSSSTCCDSPWLAGETNWTELLNNPESVAPSANGLPTPVTVGRVSDRRNTNGSGYLSRTSDPHEGAAARTKHNNTRGDDSTPYYLRVMEKCLSATRTLISRCPVLSQEYKNPMRTPNDADERDRKVNNTQPDNLQIFTALDRRMQLLKLTYEKRWIYLEDEMRQHYATDDHQWKTLWAKVQDRPKTMLPTSFAGAPLPFRQLRFCHQQGEEHGVGELYFVENPEICSLWEAFLSGVLPHVMPFLPVQGSNHNIEEKNVGGHASNRRTSNRKEKKTTRYLAALADHVGDCIHTYALQIYRESLDDDIDSHGDPVLRGWFLYSILIEWYLIPSVVFRYVLPWLAEQGARYESLDKERNVSVDLEWVRTWRSENRLLRAQDKKLEREEQHRLHNQMKRMIHTPALRQESSPSPKSTGSHSKSRSKSPSGSYSTDQLRTNMNALRAKRRKHNR
jgi:hypothetical protein